MELFQPLAKIGDPIQEVVLPLMYVHEGKIYPVGSSFIISSSGILMTATHVIDEMLRIGGTKLNADGTLQPAASLYALYIDGNLNGGLIPVDRVWSNGTIDIAVCFLRTFYKDDKRFMHKAVTLEPYPPPVGSEIIGFGYHAMKGSYTFENDQNVVNYEQSATTSTGTIQTIYDLKRDDAMVKWPSFHTTARFDGGMSGGPIFNAKTGSVCGVVCSSLDGEQVSFASIIWPAMGLIIDILREEAQDKSHYPLIELASKGHINLDKSLGDIIVDIIGDTQKVRYSPKLRTPEI